MYESNCNNESKYNNETKPSGFPKTNSILHDIRNMKLLTKEQLATILKMSDQEKMEVILTYDSIMHSINDIINNM
jgi:hypothetical protein